MNEAAQPRRMNLNNPTSRLAFTGSSKPMEKQTEPMTTTTTPPETVSSVQPTVAQEKPDNTDTVLTSVYGNGNSSKPPVKPVAGATAAGTPPKKKKSIFARWWFRLILAVVLLVLFIGAPAFAVGSYTMATAAQLKLQADDAQRLAEVAYDKFKAQNLPEAQKGLEEVRGKLQDIRGTYTRLEFYNKFPFASGYYQDGIHGLNAADAGVDAGLKALQSVNQYADVLGFTGEGTFTGGSAEERLKLMLQTLSKITPELDAIGADLDKVQAEINEIDPNRYPEEFQGRKVRAQIVAAQQLSAGAATALNEFRPVIERIPFAAGADGKRKKYLVLFQNDNELRPTGGFLTAYSVIFVENGKVTPEKSDDIYELDKKFAKKIPIPPVLGKYLTTETKWNMRDMNIDPDFITSMDQFIANYKNVPGEPRDIDGVIAIDTHVLVELLKVLGPVEVPGYGTFSAETDPKCDCPQIIHALSEIITRPTPYIRPDRKGILGPMMGAVLQKAYSAPKTQWPQMFETAWKNVQGRHVQMYFFDPETQAAAEKVNAAGRLVKDPNAQDFLAIVNANLGGAKSNLFITYKVDQFIGTPTGGSLDKKVTITYKNSRPGDNCNLEAGLLCLNARNRDWTRIYVPKGSKVNTVKGFREGTLKTADEGEFTVIEGEFFLDPNSQAKLELDYTIPYTDEKEYKVKVWKQGGVGPLATDPNAQLTEESEYAMNFDVNGERSTVLLDKDILFTTKF
jgi:hypothetical protein